MFAGSCQADYLLKELTYKEAIALRDARVKRKNKEFENEEELSRKYEEAQQRLAAQNRLLK